MKKAAMLSMIAVMIMAGSAFADLKEISNTAEFEKVIREATVPVVVKFSAYWWGSCTTLKSRLVKIAPSYSDEQVLLCTVDAYVNSDLKKYLMGGYPTVRTFFKGQVTKSSFLGAKSETFIRSFLDSVVKNPAGDVARQAFRELKTSKELEELIASSQVPVFVKFSKSTWGACQRLKAKMIKIAPSYSDQQVLLTTIDVLENPDMRKYLMGGTPTIRVFFKGKMAKASFLGDQDESFVRDFINKIIKEHQTSRRQAFRELETSKQLRFLIASSQVPVLVKFSKSTWGACQKLKAKMIRIAPSYSEQQVLLTTIDILENPDMAEFLLGGTPTVRVFSQGKIGNDSFLGDQDEAFVRSFINQVIDNSK